MLKAAVDGSFPYQKLPNTITLTGPVQSHDTPYHYRDRERGWAVLVKYAGTDTDRLTLNGEINKLASSIGLARDFAGIHWRSD